MADSKITQLPLSPYALDKDYVVIVTGHLEEGSHPYNVKMPLSYIRRYIVRLNLLASATSGINSYYNSGLNVLTMWTTGIHAIPGNHVEVQFDSNTPASNKYGGVGPISYSGIISVTGTNSRTENNIVKEYESVWPYTGVYYNTGLNAIVGNNMDIVYSRAADASDVIHDRDGPWQRPFDKYINMENKYLSGIISTTGLNAYDQNLMRIDFDAGWPHSGAISQTGLNAIRGNMIDIQFSPESEAAQSMDERNGNWHTNFSSGLLGELFHSGIISITGLNAYSGFPYGNLMRVDYNSEEWPYSGILSTTGLNAIVGNCMDIVFAVSSPAATAMQNRDSSWPEEFSTGNLSFPYHSGIVSTTGLNAYKGHPHGNLMRLDHDSVWPHSGILSTTGLNAIQGNLVDIQFSPSSLAASGMHNRNGSWYNAFNSGTHLGELYNSGIISITGVNAITENNIVKEYQDKWPYSGIYYNTGINAVTGNLIEITYDTDRYRVATIATTGLNMVSSHGMAHNINEAHPHDYAIITIDRSIGKNSSATFINDTAGSKTFTESEMTLYFGDLYNSYPNTTIQFLATLIIGAGGSLGTTQIPSSSSNRNAELIGAPTVGSNYNINNWVARQVNLSDSNFLTISISGSDVDPIASNKSISTKSSYNYAGDPGTINLDSAATNNYEDIIEQKSIASIYLNDYGCSDSLGLRPQYTLNNVYYTRTYEYSNSGIYHTSSQQRATNTKLIFYSNEGRVLTAQHFYDPPSIVWKKQPNQPVSNIEVDAESGFVSLTGIAVSTDYTKVKYQWYTSSDNQTFVPMFGQTSSVLNTTVTSTRYFKSLATLYTCDSSFSNVVTVTVPVTDIICSHPSDVTICDSGTISLSAGATLSGAPPGASSEITYRWYNGGTPLSSGETSNGNYTGTHTASLSISNADISYHRGRSYRLKASYYVAPVESSGYIMEENDIYNIVTETNQYQLITEKSILSPGQLYECYSSGAVVWEAFANTLSSPTNYASIRDYALFFGSGEAGRTDGTTTEYLTPSYSWQRSANGTGEWQGVSSNYFSQQSLGLSDYQYVTGVLGGNVIPPTALFLNNLTSGNHLDQYRLITSYGCASSTGNPAVLSVEQIVITGTLFGVTGSYKFPDNDTYNNIVLTSGQDLRLEIEATAFNSSATLHYQWQSGTFTENNNQSIDANSWANMPGQTNSILYLSNLPETNSGLYSAYRVLIDDNNISSVPTDETDTLRRKTSSSVKIGNPAFVADPVSEDILYNSIDQEWSVSYQGESEDVDPPIIIISGLRPLNNISYDISIRSILDETLGSQTGYLHIYDVGVPEISSTGTSQTLANGVEAIDLASNTGIFLSVTGVPGLWFAGFTIPSG